MPIMLSHGVVALAFVFSLPGNGACVSAALWRQDVHTHSGPNKQHWLERQAWHMQAQITGSQDLTATQHPFWHFETHYLCRYEVYICLFVLFLAAVLCAAGGIGGGGIYVTVLMVAGKLGVMDAVPLAKAIVFFGSISSWVLNSRKLVAWETKRETAIDYNICRLVIPGALSGTLVGVILNWRLPGWTILMVLSLILVFITISVTWTTARQYAQEQAEALEDERLEAEIVKEVQDKLHGTSSFGGYGPRDSSTSAAENASAQPACMGLLHPVSLDKGGIFAPRRASRIRRPSMNAPDTTKMRNKILWWDITLCIGILFAVITAGVLRFHVSECLGAPGADQQRACGHPMLFWLGRGTLESWLRYSGGNIITTCTIVVPLSACTLVELFYARLLIRYERWRVWEVLLYSLVATLTGCLSGLVGIGGGLIFSPFFLLVGVHPSVAVATSSTCVIFTSASTSLQYLLTDRIIISLTLVYGTMSLGASYLGTSFVHFLEERFWGRKSFVSFIVGLGVALSTILSITKLCCMMFK
mmetsp:Transcript_41261/g.114705  ORF Transcript_41261/g.114705 Transcript_41261/m.114705 type:complete len:530 (-) Transcript_41261:199-1788(-)|eukprot:CAMPEP_0179105634 /NCGR_PEP_ID=MMETSP0796-20121207/49069_1 /TAXON_ID=73915 /ORGANISM="Pyrodinium bahamense, Strain pbaha01" /LENGTH=529 /DNA_ID=CAMNT_0020803627 /DNA_START=63 /DNA_END=1652 /DNA_ORIENTATION=-